MNNEQYDELVERSLHLERELAECVNKIELHEEVFRSARAAFDKHNFRLMTLERQAFACKWISILSLIIVGFLVLIK
jgi:hypothetical protein